MATNAFFSSRRTLTAAGAPHPVFFRPGADLRASTAAASGPCSGPSAAAAAAAVRVSRRRSASESLGCLSPAPAGLIVMPIYHINVERVVDQSLIGKGSQTSAAVSAMNVSALMVATRVRLRAWREEITPFWAGRAPS